MRALLALVAIFQVSVAMARPAVDGRLVDCNISNGPDQQVVVTRESEGLKLWELTNTGRWDARALSTAEYQSGILRLRGDEWGSKATLTSEDGAWFYELKGDGVSIQEYADCR